MYNSFFFFLIAAILQSGISLCQSSITNIRVYDTIPNLPDLYVEKTTLFNKQPVEKGRIIFLGNSITQGGDWSKLLNNETILNRGIGGDNTYGLLQRLDEITKRKPSQLFILIGINDISKDIPVPVIADNYRKILDRIQKESPDTKIYVQSVLPLNTEYPGFPQHFDKKDKVTQLNDLLKKLAIKTKVEFIDLAPVFVDSQNRLNEKFTTDGLHLNEKGYEVWVRYLKEKGYIK